MPSPAASSVRQPTVRHLQQLTAQLLDGVILVDPAGTILDANAAALRMHGVGSAEELGATAEDYAARFSLRSPGHGPLKHREYPLFRLLAGDSFPDLIVEVAPAGESEARWVHQVRDVVMDEDGGEPDCLALVLSDVSDRFDAEARFQAMFKANPAPALIVRQRDGRVTRANPGFLSLTGFNPEQLTGRSLFALDLLGSLSDADIVRRRLEAGEVVPRTEAELLVADGSRRRVVFAGQPVDVTDEDALLLTFADLEPQRRALWALEEAERHLSAVFEMAPVAMTITRDADHRIVRANAAFRTLTGYPDDHVVGRTADALNLWRNGEQRSQAEDEVRRRGGLRDLNARLLTADGAAVEGLVSAETIDAEGAARVLWLYQDVTERRRSEQELAAAIDEAMKDATWLSRSILDRLAALRRPGEPAAAVELSRREREVLQLICDDLDDGEIARRLDLSRNTVRNHVARLYAKIGVGRRSAAVIWGRERGMGTSAS